MADSESDAVLAKLKKEHGELIGSKGVQKGQVARIPTGIFPFDLATGGGFPQGRVSIVFGPESCGKTTLSLRSIAAVQHSMKLRGVFIDIEHTYDSTWAKKCGVDSSELLYFQPDTAEQAVDIAEAMLCANDVGIVVIDSVAAMITEKEIENDASTAAVGGSSQIVGKMIRKAVGALGRETKRNHVPALVLINQNRYKIGQMYGNPEYFPGGQSLKFASSLTVRLYAKDKMDKKIHPHLAAFRETSGVIQKNKLAIVNKAFEYDLCLIPNGTMKETEVPSWNLVSAYLKKYGLLSKDGNKWDCMGVKFDALYVLEERYNTEPELRASLQKEIVDREVLTPVSVDSDVDKETGEIKSE